jgi:hypothetical protein
MIQVRFSPRLLLWCITVLPLHVAIVRPTQAQVVISQVYGGGGASTGSPSYKNDFIELFNRGTDPFDLAGHSVQYASATGSSWSVTQLSGLILPGQYYLIQESGGLAGDPLPLPDTAGTMAMSAINGKIAFVAGTASLTGACPSDPAIIDLVGYGSASCFEGTGAVPALSTTLSALRSSEGCSDTDDNARDFVTGAPIPRTRSTLAAPCGPVPIHLSYFNGILNVPRGSIDLEWGTESETNNYGFEIQKKLVEAPLFETLPNSFVAGHGTTLTPQQYAYSDTVVLPGTWYYRLAQIDLNGTYHHSNAIQVAVVTGLADAEVPDRFVLLRNYPNPFNPSTIIEFSVAAPGNVVLGVHNLLGQRVSTLVDGHVTSGTHKFEWNGGGYAGGVYICRLQAGNTVRVQKLVMVK